MTRTKIALTLAFGALGTSLVAPPAQARPYTIKAGEWVVTKLGPLKTKSTRNYAPTIRRAIAAFGHPSSRFTSHGGCIVKWKRLGLRIEFYNFGFTEGSVCNADIGRAQSFTIKRARRSWRWRTWNGLRVGMPERRIWDLHPRAEWVDDSRFHDQGYWLRWNYSPFGDGAKYPILSAHLRNGYSGRVKSFGGWIGSAGE